MKPVLVVAPCEKWENEAAFRIRLGALADAMHRRGFQWDIRARPPGPLGRMAMARSAGAYHAVILHRKMIDPYEARALRRHVRPPCRIVMDIDDATMYHETKLGAFARWRLERRFAATAGILDLACTGNDYLADIFQKRGVTTRLMPSVVEPSHYQVKQHAQTQQLRLVWIGSGSTLKYLEAGLPSFEAAAHRIPNLTLCVICDRPPALLFHPAADTLKMEFIKWSLDAETTSLICGDIGIAPMPEDRWTLGKCGFKIVQYMAAGLPVIASPVGVNRALVNGAPANGDAAGLLAARWEEWPEAIETLARDVALRQTLGMAGRRRVEAELCVEKIADRWAEVLG